MSERAATQAPAPSLRARAVVERCATTGITKPECHCPACLAALVANHHRPPGRP